MSSILIGRSIPPINTFYIEPCGLGTASAQAGPSQHSRHFLGDCPLRQAVQVKPLGTTPAAKRTQIPHDANNAPLHKASPARKVDFATSAVRANLVLTAEILLHGVPPYLRFPVLESYLGHSRQHD